MMEDAHGPPASEGRVGVLPVVCAQHNAVPCMQWGSGQALRLILGVPRPTKVQEHASLTQTSVSSALLRPVCSVNRSDDLFKPKRLRGSA